ncbi:hypothetical protein BC829DRAFT_258387 [Chytridium lagenaria]|nr:hypothetical protein BC829DRAFT_258387 [Chytridium lagenaria]
MVQYATASHRPTFNSPPKSLAPITTTAHRPSFSLEPISQDPRQASHHNDLHRKRSAAPSPMPDALPQIDSPFLPHISPTPRSATPTFPFSRDSVSSYPSASSASPRSNTPTSLYSPTSPMSRTRNMSSPPIVVAFRPASRQSLHPQSNRPQTPDNPTQNFSPPIDAPIHYFRTARRVPSNSSFASCTSSSAIDSRRGSLPKFTDVPPAQGPPPSSRRKFNLWGRPSIDNLQVSRSRSSLDVSSSRLSEEPEEKERRRPSFFAKRRFQQNLQLGLILTHLHRPLVLWRCKMPPLLRNGPLTRV